jgi:hypothetical protein
MTVDWENRGRSDGAGPARRQRRGLANPLQRDLDRVRLAGMDRLATLSLEALPGLDCVAATAAALGVDAAAAPGTVRAMAVREVLLEALDDLGPGADAAAIRALFGATPSESGEPDLRSRETAAAALIDRSWDTYRRRVRTEILPRVAEAVLGVERRHAEPPAGGPPTLEIRSDQPRVERWLEQATESVFVSGINLDAVAGCIRSVTDIARAGVHVRLLALDPRGRMLLPFAQFSGVDPDVRRSKIASNLRHLGSHITGARGKILLHTTDTYLTTGYIGVDLHLPSGVLIAQHYLKSIGPDESPTVRVERRLHPSWYDVYERALEDSWRQSTEYARSGPPPPARSGDRFARRTLT